MEEDLVQALRLVGQDPLHDRDPRLPQAGEAPSAHVRVRISCGHDHPLDPSLEDCIHARRGLLPRERNARFEVEVEVPSPRPCPGLEERHRLGVRAAAHGVVALGDDLAILHHHRPDERVGAGPPRPELGEVEGPPHERFVRPALVHNSSAAAWGSGVPKIADPATTTSAPASTTFRTFPGPIPPSTAISTARSPISRRRA